MSKRNFVLFIIFLLIAGIFAYLFLSSRNGGTTPPGDDTGTNFFSRFNPFGSTPKSTPPPTTPIDISGETPTPPEETPATIEKLRKISSMPISGFEILNKERLKEVGEVVATPTSKPTPPATELAPATRYVARADGNIYQTFLDNLAERKFSSTIIPQVYEAAFGNKNSSVLMRYLKNDRRTVESFLGTIPKEVLGADTESNEIKGVFLSDNITDFSISPDSTKIFYLLNIGDNIVGTTLNFTDSKKTQIFDSPFNEWLSFWPNATTITLTTKPSYAAQGHMYALNTTNKSFIRVLGDIYGLTTLTSPDAKFVLYGNNGLNLSVYDVTKKTSTLLGVRTLPEKCIWSSSILIYCAVPTLVNPNQYPDDWYQGEVSFTDQIWKLDLVNSTTDIIVDPLTVKGGEAIDGIKLKLDASGKYLLFVNKKDSLLWELELN
jgi:hypothetical protein